MTAMKISNSFLYSDEVKLISKNLGLRIRSARVRRKLRQEDLALNTGLSRSTIQSIERGDLSCSMGALFHVLWTLGVSNELDLIADPGLDRDGLSLALDAQSKRVHVPRALNNDF